MAYSTLAGVKGYLGIPTADTSRDAWISALIGPAEEIISQICRRDFNALSTFKEYYSGTGTNRLALRQFPVYSVLGVWVDDAGFNDVPSGAFESGTLLTHGVDYVFDPAGSTAILDPVPVTPGAVNHDPPFPAPSAVLVRLNTVWPMFTRVASTGWLAGALRQAAGNIKVCYSAGGVPDDIKYATALAIAECMRTAPLGGASLTKERIKDYQYEISDGLRGACASVGAIRSILASRTVVPVV